MPDNDESLPVFEEIFNKYKQQIFALACRILKDVPEAEDVTQEVFIKVYNSFSDFRRESEIFSWIYRIGINKCKDYSGNTLSATFVALRNAPLIKCAYLCVIWGDLWVRSF